MRLKRFEIVPLDAHAFVHIIGEGGGVVFIFRYFCLFQTYSSKMFFYVILDDTWLGKRSWYLLALQQNFKNNQH